MSATLISPILTEKIIKPLRTAVPQLAYLSVDWGKQGEAFAEPVKFGQEVTSWMVTAPTAEEYTPGGGLGTNAANVKDLISDVKVKIDMAAKVSIKLPTADAVKYLLSPAFKETLTQATISLGRFVLNKVIAKVNSANFSQEKVVTVAAAEYESLMDTRAALNKLGTLMPRFVIGSTDWVNNLAKDPVIASGDYHDQRTTENPYITLTNVAGFEAVSEWPNMPTNTVEVGTVAGSAANDTLTLNAHGLPNGTRVRFAGGTLPAGLLADTDYYVRDTDTNTFKVAATPGGVAINLTADGSGAVKVSRFEQLNAVAMERRAIHIAFRGLLDNSQLARELGIPETSRKVTSTDPDTGATVTWHFWEDATGTNPTGDVYATGVIAFGIRAGRELVASGNAATDAPGSGLDYGAIRLVETPRSA